MRTQRPERLRAPPATEEARPPAGGHRHSLVLGQTGIPGLGTLTATLEKHVCASQIRPQCDSLSSDDTLELNPKEKRITAFISLRGTTLNEQSAPIFHQIFGLV